MKCKIDLDGKWKETSIQFCKFLDYTPKELQGRSLKKIVHPDDEPEVLDILDKLNDGTIREFETTTRCITKSGDTVRAHINGDLVRDSDGAPEYVVCYIQDVTEKNRELNKLQESEQKFRSLFEHNPHPVYYFDLEGHFKGVNSKLAEFTGYSREELLGMSYEEFIVEEDLEKTRAQFRKAASGEPGEYEIRVRVRDGSQKDIRVTKFPMYVGDEMTGVFGILQDITKQKRRDKKLKRSEQRFRSLFEHNPDAVYSFDLEGNFVMANKALAELTGYAKAELEKMGFDPLVPEDQKEYVWEKFEQAARGNPQTYEAKGVHKDGHIFELQITNLPIYVDGEIEGVFGIAHDITSEKQAQRRVQESEERWHKLVEDNPQPVQIVQEGKIIFMNRAGLELYGTTDLSDIVGKRVVEFCHPDYRAYLLKRKARLEDNVAIKSGELKMVRVDGGERYIETHSIPIKYKGEAAIQTVIHDITERKEAEEALRRNEKRMSRLFSNLPGIAYRCKNDRDWTMLFVSEGSKELTGYEPEALMGKDSEIPYGDLIHEEDRQYVWDSVQEAIKKQEPFELNYRIYDKEGNIRWVWERGVATNQGDEVLLEGFISDISQQKMAEQQIRDSLKEKEVLLQEIHHRVKNNLAIISGLLELQAMNSTDKETLNTLRESQLRIQSMAMIHQKLYQSEALSNIGFDHYVKELVETIQRTYDFDGKRIKVNFNLDPVKLNINQAIPSALILNELVANCFKHAFIGREEGIVNIGLSRSNDHVELQVADNGQGIDSDFDIESQHSLGMTLVSTLSTQLEGELEIQPKTNDRGTKIILRFEPE